jgi:hypothetical protein
VAMGCEDAAVSIPIRTPVRAYALALDPHPGGPSPRARRMSWECVRLQLTPPCAAAPPAPPTLPAALLAFCFFCFPLHPFFSCLWWESLREYVVLHLGHRTWPLRACTSLTCFASEAHKRSAPQPATSQKTRGLSSGFARGRARRLVRGAGAALPDAPEGAGAGGAGAYAYAGGPGACACAA